MSSHVYPSIEELMPQEMYGMIPASLAMDIQERYATLGEKYLTEQRHTDGRMINNCMFKDSAQDAIEEVVDAVFNTLVMIFKSRVQDTVPSDYVYTCLKGLMEVYSLLYTLREANR